MKQQYRRGGKLIQQVLLHCDPKSCMIARKFSALFLCAFSTKILHFFQLYNNICMFNPVQLKVLTISRKLSLYELSIHLPLLVNITYSSGQAKGLYRRKCENKLEKFLFSSRCQKQNEYVSEGKAKENILTRGLIKGAKDFIFSKVVHLYTYYIQSFNSSISLG